MIQSLIYTDGACSGNPGPGGSAAIILTQKTKKEISVGYRFTTNNRMELIAVILAFENLSDIHNAILYTDSKYIIDTINNGWLEQWIKKGWRLSNNKPVKNADLWQKVSAFLKILNVEWRWVEGHSGDKYNERCNYLAVKALKKPVLLDEFYEQTFNPLGL